MSTSNSGYNASDVVNVNPDPDTSSTSFGVNVDARRSSNSSFPGADPNSFLSLNYRKFDELRRLLDSSKDSLKLEAMRRIIEMVARGQNCSELFAGVVKNVVSKNTEVRKLVYIYLERYAEEQQDLALLSVSTFQKALKDPNQLIRSCALRVLSSIRVPMIAPIVMLAIKECSQDMSPFVRKTVAHSIPKLHSLDPTQGDQLIDVIEKLMKDQFTMVIGSAIVAFEQVCPDRVVFIHHNYRKLCNVLPDIDEWGQVFVLHMLTRYARTQFLDPNKCEAPIDGTFYSNSESSSEDAIVPNGNTAKSSSQVIDADHRLLLRSAKSLLHSRNSSVVLAVVQLYYHVAPKNELAVLVRPMTRLLKSHREIRTIVLTNIATISANNPSMFEPFLRLFYITTDEPTHVKKIKLEILINISNEVNAASILREFSIYLFNDDFLFVSAAIHAIGRIASKVPDISDICLSGLLGLLSSTDSGIAGESIVVIQRLLQLGPKQNEDVIIRLSNMLDKTDNSSARASIIWMIGEHCDHVPKIAPDVLRKAAKMFSTEPDAVKHQILNLASKLFCHNSKQARILSQYVFSLARYDQSYDIRDKARLYKNLLFSPGDSVLPKYAKKLFVYPKPAPLLKSPYKDRDHWQLGSLSHYLNLRVIGYKSLANFPLTASSSTLREVLVDFDTAFVHKQSDNDKITDENIFYSSDSESTSSDSYTSDSDTQGSSDSDSSTHTSASSLSQLSFHQDKSQPSHDNDLYSQTRSTSCSPSSDDIEANSPVHVRDTHGSELVILDEAFGQVDSMDSSLLDCMSDERLMCPNVCSQEEYKHVMPIFVNPVYKEVLNKYNGKGISIGYRMLRRQFSDYPSTIEVELLIENHDCLKMYSDISLNPDIDTKMYLGNNIGNILPQTKVFFSVGIDFHDSLQPAKFFVRSLENQLDYLVYIHPSCGELMLPIGCSDAFFFEKQKKLGGMSVTKGEFNSKMPIESINNSIIELCNFNLITTSITKCLCYAGITASNTSIVLATIFIHSDDVIKLEVNCDHVMMADILFSNIKEILTT